MPGGLIQIASYGSQELTLTGNPQITFFKIVFRRYTNFGIRTIEISFDNPVNFGTVSTITIPKYGDLLTKVTLKIKLPSFDLTNLNSQLSSDNQLSNTQMIDLEKYYLFYDFFINFINKLKNVTNTFFEKNINSGSITYIQDLKKYILTFIQQDEYLQFFKIVNSFLYNTVDNSQNIQKNKYVNTFTNASLFKINSDNIFTYIYQDYNENYYSYDIFNFMVNENMKILDELNDIIYKKLINKFTIPNIVSMGWIKKIGIFIMDYVEMYIGSNIITKMSSNYMDINGQLNYKNVEIYNQMIGNTPQTNNSTVKNNKQYLYVPLPFWFLNNYGLSIPLIALQFNNIQFKFKFKELIETIFFNVSNISSVTNDNLRNQIINLVLSNTINILQEQLEITLLAEYVFLDNIERKKFAQSSHEYLITQVQEITFTNVSPFLSNFELDFFHCCKTMFWSANQYKYINNMTGENIYDNYTVSLYKPSYTNNDINYINYIKMLYNSTYSFNLDAFIEGLNTIYNSPINTILYNNDIIIAQDEVQNYKIYNVSPFVATEITLNGTSLVSQNFPYFNYLQPYNYFKNTPLLGINAYSFSLGPTETQPSGSCNLSRIPKTSINFNLINTDSNLTNVTVNNNFAIIDNASSVNLNNYKINIQVENYNVLRFIGGIVGVAFTY
jgi:hypothetical protein